MEAQMGRTAASSANVCDFMMKAEDQRNPRSCWSVCLEFDSERPKNAQKQNQRTAVQLRGPVDLTTGPAAMATRN